MADPVVHLTNGVPDSGTGNITTLGAVVTALGTPMQQTGGSVTANAGTNLNTSALALETGGNLASIATNTGRIPAQGQALAAASIPVVLTAIQQAALTPPTTVSSSQFGAWNVTNITGTITLPTGAATSNNQTMTQAPVAAGTATATRADLVGAQFLTTQPTMTNTQQASLLQSSRGELLVAPGVSGFPIKVADGSGNLVTSTTGALDVNIKSGVNANFEVAGTSGTASHQGAPVVNLDIYSQYETVAVSTTATLGATGAVGDYLAGVLIVPGAAGCGAVSIADGNGSAISIFAGGGTTALPSLVPFMVPLGLYALAATTPGWKITTGANVTAVGIGKFT